MCVGEMVGCVMDAVRRVCVEGMVEWSCTHCRKKVGVRLEVWSLENLARTSVRLHGAMALPCSPSSTQRRARAHAVQAHEARVAR